MEKKELKVRKGKEARMEGREKRGDMMSKKELRNEKKKKKNRNA